MKLRAATILLATTLLAGAASFAPPARAGDNGAGIEIVADDIGGTVTSAKGPEAGVWVIAETKELPTRYIKIVVTDDQGRYVLPTLPKAKYQVWVRGYGLTDSKPVEATPGSKLDLKADVAPDAKAAAEYYPAAYWYAMIQPPAESEFPGTGTGASGNGIAPTMLTQQHWLENMKENCMFCHQLGDKATREILTPGNSVEAWSQRIQMVRADGDPAINNNGKDMSQQMQNNMAHFGRDRALKMYATWTDAIAAGQTPKVTPPRPAGVERNLVLTIMDWGGGRFVHDQISSDHRDPTVNAGGPVYGMGMLHSQLEILDPKTLKTSTIPIPGLEGQAHDDTVRIHADEMDGKGRVWMPTVSTASTEPAYCSDGSMPSSKYFPLADHKKAAQLVLFDPKTQKVENIPLCSGGNHSNFTFDKDSTLWLSGDTSVISWFNTRIWDETHDPQKASGWCPMVLDTSGDGKIDPDRTKWAQPGDALKNVAGEEGAGPMAAEKAKEAEAKANAGKDTRISRYLYGMAVAKDGSVWEAAYVPYVPSGIVHLIPGKNPPETCKTEYYEPPLKDGKYSAVGIRGVGIDSAGVAWAAFSSGQVGAFDRRKCKVVNGPTATGQQCPEGWTFYDLPSPKVGNTFATSDFVYSEWDDMHDVVGLGKETHFFPATNSDSIVALPEGQSKFVTLRVPYPMGFYTRGLDFRIDDAKDGWKGKAMHATYSSGVQWHQEGGEGEYSKEVAFQLRPNPLAH
jgi:hypothetical protein